MINIKVKTQYFDFGLTGFVAQDLPKYNAFKLKGCS